MLALLVQDQPNSPTARARTSGEHGGTRFASLHPLKLRSGAGNPGAVHFLQQVLIPVLRRHKPGATIAMDNLAARRIPQAHLLLESAGFTLLPVPHHSPDLNPIELYWSKLKTPRRTAEPRSLAAIEEHLVPALDTITPRDAKGWFRHCGHSVSN